VDGRELLQDLAGSVDERELQVGDAGHVSVDGRELLLGDFGKSIPGELATSWSAGAGPGGSEVDGPMGWFF